MTIPQIVGVLRKVIPVILAVDMVHNFYYVGCMIQEKRQRYQERAHRELAVNVGAAICQVSKICRTGEFWPQELATLLDSVVLPSLDLPPPSYEDHRPPVSLLNKLGSSIPLLNSPVIWGAEQSDDQHSGDDGWEQSEATFDSPVLFEENDLQNEFDPKGDKPPLQNSTGDVAPCCSRVRWEVYHAA